MTATSTFGGLEIAGSGDWHQLWYGHASSTGPKSTTSSKPTARTASSRPRSSELGSASELAGATSARPSTARIPPIAVLRQRFIRLPPPRTDVHRTLCAFTVYRLHRHL